MTLTGGCRHMKGLRWIFAFLRDPTGALGGSIATVRARLAPLESRIQLTVTEALRKAARKLALGAVAAAFALVGVAYVLIGLWLGLESLLGPIGASFVLVAMCLTIVVRAVLAKAGVEDELPAPILVYLSVTLAFTFALWLLWLS